MLRPINLNDDSIQQPITTLKQTSGKMVPDASNFGETTWVSSYFVDFKRRMLSLLGYDFRHLSCALGFQFIGHRNPNQGQAGEAQENTELIQTINKDDLAELISPFDLKRLDQYSKNMVDFHLIMDLLPTIAKLFFLQKTLPADSVCLSYVQSAILIGMGLQYKKVDDLEADLGLNAGQLLPQFNKLIRKFTKVIRMVYEDDIQKKMGDDKVIDLGNQGFRGSK